MHKLLTFVPYRTPVMARPAWIFAIMITVAIGAVVAAQDRRLLTGKSLAKALQQRRGFNTTGVALRQTLADFQDHTGIPIVLDRRIDPTTPLEVSTKYVTTAEVLESVATALTFGAISVTDNYVLVGPREPTERLRTLLAIKAEEQGYLRKDMDPDLLRQLVRAEHSSWDDLAEPRQLLLDRCQRIGLTITNPDRVPYDLWASSTLPKLAFAEFATCVLNQFDLTYTLAADGELTITEVPVPIAMTRRHRVSSRDKVAVMLRWKNAYPDLKIIWRGSTALVSATVETHEDLEELIRNGGVDQVPAAGIRGRSFTMSVPAGTSYGQLIETFRQSGVPIHIHGLTAGQLNDRLQGTIAFDLKAVPGRLFFPRILAAWMARVEVNDDEVVVTFPD